MIGKRHACLVIDLTIWFICFEISQHIFCLVAVYADGSICLDILQNRWSPTYDVSAILTSIQSLLDEPNPNSPANSLAAQLYQENRREYEKRVAAIVEQSWLNFNEDEEKEAKKELQVKFTLFRINSFVSYHCNYVLQTNDNSSKSFLCFEFFCIEVMNFSYSKLIFEFESSRDCCNFLSTKHNAVKYAL